jgi:uncharacterized protein (DUF1778 family)
MVTITIHGVPESVRDELEARARRSGRTLQDFLLAALCAAARRPSASSVIERAQRRARHVTSPVTISEILEARDADRC